MRWSNEAATVHADITADHRDVPANHFQLLQQPAKLRTGKSNFSPFQNAASVHFKLLGCTHFQPFDGVSLLLLFCTLDTFQIMNSNGFSIQVCVRVCITVCVCLYSVCASTSDVRAAKAEVKLRFSRFGCVILFLFELVYVCVYYCLRLFVQRLCINH